MKIMIFGGSFDPPHNGHVRIAKEVLEKKIVDKVWLVPHSEHAFNKQTSLAMHRLEMLKILAGKNIEVCDYEVKKGGKSYTIDTLEHFRKERPLDEFSLLIGSDQIGSFDKWKDYKKILNDFKVYVYPRVGYKTDNLFKGMVLLKDVDETDISSTEIRDRLINEKPIENLVDKKIEDYINKKGLYMENKKCLDEIKKIENFLRGIFKKTKKQKAVVAVSGGIDSAMSLTLLSRVLPVKNIFPVFLPYGKDKMTDAKLICEWNKIPKENWIEFDIKGVVDKVKGQLKVKNGKLRIGNIMARSRMIFVYDVAKEKEALVCGTENKSEKYLGYFTRFGDQASDLEPIEHLYKTELAEIARFLKLPESILTKAPSAGLWNGQTDEDELGFSYKQADLVMGEYIDKNRNLGEIKIKDVSKDIIKKIIARIESQKFKRQVPYTL